MSPNAQKGREGLTRVLAFRLTDAEMTSVDRAAELSGIRPSAWVRAVVQAVVAQGDLRHSLTRTPEVPAPVRLQAPALIEYATQLRKVGVNLNQLTRAVNAGELVMPAEVTHVLHEVQNVVAERRAALGDRRAGA